MRLARLTPGSTFNDMTDPTATKFCLAALILAAAALVVSLLDWAIEKLF